MGRAGRSRSDWRVTDRDNGSADHSISRNSIQALTLRRWAWCCFWGSQISFGGLTVKADELAITVVALATGIVAGFVVWTYVGPMISGRPATTTP